jgi:hypothetical protein
VYFYFTVLYAQKPQLDAVPATALRSDALQRLSRRMLATRASRMAVRTSIDRRFHVPCTDNDSADFGGIVSATLCTRELHRVRCVAVLVECIVPACDRSGGRGRGASPATFTSSQGRCSLDE